MPETNDDSSFSRERLAGYDPTVLQRGVVLFAGAGALAQNTMTNVALPGVGEIRVIDFDEFESHNATRSPYYPTDDDRERWGMLKATVVAHRIQQVMLAEHPLVRFAASTIQALGLGAFDGVDVVVAGVDNPRARAYLSDACRLLNIALVEAGFDGPNVSMSCFPPTNDRTSPCYRCGNSSLTGTFSCQRHAQEAAKRGIIAAIQPAAAALAGLQAEATLQALHGRYPAGFNRASLNVRTGESRRYCLVADPDCEGLHDRLSIEPQRLEVSAECRLGDLVAAVEASLGEGSAITLPEPFVIEAYCMSCGDVVRVQMPEWAYDMQPRCTNCDGPWRSIGPPPTGHSPTKPTAVGRFSDDETLASTCRSAGLAPLAIFTAQSDDGSRTAAFQLTGTLDDLYQTVTEAGRRE